MPSLTTTKSLIIRKASTKDHKAIMAVAKLTKWTKDFGNQVMFSSDAAYARGWIRVAVENSKVVGFSCFREKVRIPEVVLYFVGVATEAMGRGVGWRLVEDMMALVSHRRLVLKCARDNANAYGFYKNKGFKVELTDDKYYTMSKEFS